MKNYQVNKWLQTIVLLSFLQMSQITIQNLKHKTINLQLTTKLLFMNGGNETLSTF